MENTTTQNQKGFFQNDRMLVCSMLVFYGFCIIGLAFATFWWLNHRGQTISVNATSTAYALATQQVQGTATAIVRGTELAKYELIDRFDSNKNRWQTGPLLGPDWKGTPHITSGVFVWDIDHRYVWVNDVQPVVELRIG